MTTWQYTVSLSSPVSPVAPAARARKSHGASLPGKARDVYDVDVDVRNRPKFKLVKSTPIDFGIPRSREKKRQYMSNTCQYSLVLCSAVNVTQRTRLESSASNMLVCRIPFSKTSGACGLSISCKPNLSPAV